jgi:hypothetical protein
MRPISTPKKPGCVTPTIGNGTVEHDLAADYAGIAVVFVLPEGVTDHGGLGAAAAAVVVGCQKAADERLDLENSEEVAANVHAVGVAGLSDGGEIELAFGPREDARKAFLMIADLFPLRVGDVGIAA